MKLSASKIWNDSNHTKKYIEYKTTALTLMLPIMFDLINFFID